MADDREIVLPVSGMFCRIRQGVTYGDFMRAWAFAAKEMVVPSMMSALITLDGEQPTLANILDLAVEDGLALHAFLEPWVDHMRSLQRGVA